MELGNLAEAENELASVQPKNRTHPTFLEVRWQLLAAAHQWEAAVAMGRTITQEAPASEHGWIHLAFALHELRRTQEAYDTIKPVLERFPRNWLLRYNLACYACQLGNLEDARQWLNQAYACGSKMEIRKMAMEDVDLKPLFKAA